MHSTSTAVSSKRLSLEEHDIVAVGLPKHPIRPENQLIVLVSVEVRSS